MDLEDPNDFQQLSAVVKGFSNDTRLTLLLGFYHGYGANRITEFLDMTRGGLQNNISKMIDADLVYRPADDDAPTYRLTPLGAFFAQIFDEHATDILAAVRLLAETEEQYEQEIRDSPLADGLNTTEVRKLIHTKTWAEIDEEIENHLSGVQLSSSLSSLLAEDGPIQANAVVVCARLAQSDPETLKPALPQLIEIITASETNHQTRANALLAATAIIENHPAMNKQTVQQLLPLTEIASNIHEFAGNHLEIIINFARVLLILFTRHPETETNQIFETLTRNRLSPKKRSLHALHDILLTIVEEYEHRGTVHGEALAAYTDLDVSVTDIHKSRTDHKRAVIALADTVAGSMADEQIQAEVIVPDESPA